MEQKLSFNRCVTVNFHNKTSRTLNKTSGNFETEWGLHNVQAPQTINSGDNVQWDQKSDITQNLIASASYSFAQDNGQTGSVSVGWNNSKSKSNEYTLSLTTPGKEGIYYINYTGGSGDESTIDVVFYEFPYNLPQWWRFGSIPDGHVLVASDSSSVIAGPNSDVLSDDPSVYWIAMNPKTGENAWPPYNGTFKIFNRKYQAFLTASDWQNNKVCLWIGGDGPDQYWYWKNNDGQFWLMNAYSNLSLMPSGDGLVVGPPDGNQWWSVDYGG